MPLLPSHRSPLQPLPDPPRARPPPPAVLARDEPAEEHEEEARLVEARVGDEHLGSCEEAGELRGKLGVEEGFGCGGEGWGFGREVCCEEGEGPEDVDLWLLEGATWIGLGSFGV